MPVTISVTRFSARSRTSADNVRTVPVSVALSGMMLFAVPACIDPTVTTTDCSGSVSREAINCRPEMIWAEMMMGSIVEWGLAACPPRP